MVEVLQFTRVDLLEVLHMFPSQTASFRRRIIQLAFTQALRRDGAILALSTFYGFLPRVMSGPYHQFKSFHFKARNVLNRDFRPKYPEDISHHEAIIMTFMSPAHALKLHLLHYPNVMPADYLVEKAQDLQLEEVYSIVYSRKSHAEVGNFRRGSLTRPQPGPGGAFGMTQTTLPPQQAATLPGTQSLPGAPSIQFDDDDEESPLRVTPG